MDGLNGTGNIVTPGTVNFVQTLNFITRDMNSASFVYADSTVQTVSSLLVTMVPGFAIESASKIEIRVPYLLTTPNTPYIQPSATCTAVAVITGPLSCTLIDRKLIVSGGFPTGAISGSNI